MSKYTHALHESSSEEFTESQGFNKFLEADNSDEEEAALRRGKGKNQAQNYGANKGGKQSAYAGSASNYGGGYSNYGGNTGSGFSSGYNTGYSGYGAQTQATYGKSSYGAAANYGGAGSGYGGSGYGGSGYGESGYGASYGGGGYSGYDMTGFGGSGYDGGSGYGGYKQSGFESGYNAGGSGGDAYNFKIDLDEIKKRKEQQKEQKLAEQKAEEERKKREEEEKKAREKAKNAPESILKTQGKKGQKGSKVSFEPDQDSENENNNSISHITENEDEDDDHKGYNKKKSSKHDDEPRNPTDKILSNLSDSEDKREESKKKDSPDSSINYDEIEIPKPQVFDPKLTNKLAAPSKKVEEEVSSPVKKDPFKESHDSSYPEDFEGSASHNESSSKFGASTEVGKALNSIQRANEIRVAEDTPAKREEPKSDLKISPIVKLNDDKSKNDNLLSINFDNKGGIANNYDNRAAKDYVYESLLNDERNRTNNIQNKLSVDSDQLKNVKKLLEEKDLNIKRVEAHNDNLQRDLDILHSENMDLKSENNTYKVENEELVKKVDVLEQKVIEFENIKKVLERENQEKTRLLKERKEYQEKNLENRITNEMKRIHESEKEVLLLQIDDLKEENKKYLSEITKLENDLHLQKTFTRGKSDNDSEIRKLKQEVISLQSKLRDRGEEPKSSAIDAVDNKHEKNAVSGIALIDKEMQMQELMIKGFQKENEKLILENKALKKEIESLNEKLYDENKKVGDLKTRLVHNTNNVYVSDKEIDIETKKILGSENVISKIDLKDAMEKIARLQQEIAGKEHANQNRELELKYELDRLRAKNLDLEAKLGGFDLTQLKKQDEEYKKLEQVFAETKKSHEREVKDLRSKLDWYIENQDSLTGKDTIIKEKDDEIKRLQDEMKKILSDPNTNLDSKTNFYNKVINLEKNRVKKLEKDLTLLEEALKKRNPNLYEKMKNEKEETAVVKELKKTVNQLLSEKEQQDIEYENKIKDLTQKFDKMNLEFQKRSKEPASTTPSNKAASNKDHEETEVLKRRIKELEKEVQDAKNYYLKKTKEESKRPSTSTAKAQTKDTKVGNLNATKKVEFTTEEKAENKENIVYASNGLHDSEKANILSKLPLLQNTAVPLILSALNEYKQRSKVAYQKGDKNIATATNAQLTKVLSDTIKDISQTKSIIAKCNQIRDNIINDGADPTHSLIELQEDINNLIWEEIKKDSSPLTAEINQQPKINNFLSVTPAQSSGSQVDQELARKNQQLQDVLHDFEKIKSLNSQLIKEKHDLEQIIQRIPKNPTSLDFVTLEKKLEVMERNYRENEIELRNAFKKTYHYDPFGLTDTDVSKIKASYEKEIEQLKAVVLTKNKEISEFRREMEIILRELEYLRNARN